LGIPPYRQELIYHIIKWYVNIIYYFFAG